MEPGKIRSMRSSMKELPLPERPVAMKGVMMDGKAEPLSPTERLFHEPDFNCYIVVLLGSGKKIDVDVVKAGLQATLIRHPRFSSRQVFDENEMGIWLPTRVSADDHCTVVDDDPAMVNADQFVEDYVSALSKTAMDMSKPLWDLHILNVRTSDAEAVAVLRMHHSLGDGTSLMSLLLACTRKASDPESLPTIAVQKRSIPFRRLGLLGYLMDVWTLVRMLWNTVVDVALFVATFWFLKDSHTAFKGVEGVQHRPKRFVHCDLDLDDFKMVKQAMNTTISDVMLGVTSAGLSHYLCRRNDIGDLPSNLLVRAAVLVNLRVAVGVNATATMMEKQSTGSQWGNWLGYVLLPFPMVIREDPLDYVRCAKQIADRKKLSLEALFTFSSAVLFVRTCGIKVASALSHRILSNTTMSFSSVIGPSEEIVFCGHPVVYIAPTVYGHPHALTVHFQSYMNKVKLVLAVDEEAIPDPHQLCHDMGDSLALIKNAVCRM